MRGVRRHEPMASHLSNPWNNSVTYLQTSYGAQALGNGSGFFWAHGSQIFQVSNWHIFSGRDPTNGQPLADHAGIPDRVGFTAYERTSEPDERGFYSLQVRTVVIGLYDSDLAGPRWVEHPTRGAAIDVAAINITQLVAGTQLEVRPVNELEGDAVREPFASQDVFIIGYPLGLVTGDPIPVWKRGTIATDPTFDPDGLPKVFVDTATRQGMSGSIVLARHIILGNYTKRDGTTASILYGRRDLILGIYSGRLSPHNVQAQLGIVWKRHVIDETAAGNTFAHV